MRNSTTLRCSTIRGRLARAVALICAIVVGLAACTPAKHTSRDDSAGSQANAKRPAVGTPAASVCGVSNLASVTAPADPAPLSKAFRTVVSGLPNSSSSAYFGSLQLSGNRLYASFAADGKVSIRSYSLSGKQLSDRTFGIDIAGTNDNAGQQFAVGPDGSVYLPDFTGGGERVVGVAGDGTTKWTTDLATFGKISDVFGWHDGAGKFAVGVGFGDRVVLLDEDGHVTGAPLPIAGNYFTAQADGSLVSTSISDAGKYVNRYSTSGAFLSRFGSATSLGATTSSQAPGVGAVAGLTNPYGAIYLPDGNILLADAGDGLQETTPDGYRLGLVPDAFDDSFTLLTHSPLIASSGLVYFVATTDGGSKASILSMTQASLAQQLAQPQFYNEGSAAGIGSLGYGAGLVTPAEYNYFPSGTSPQVAAVFDPWWQRVASQLQLSYTVTGAPSQGTAPLLKTGTAAITGDGRVPLALPDSAPGAYQVQAVLTDKSSGAVRGSTCLVYSVGAAGQKLDFSSLPGEPDWGGAPPQRAISLASQLGANAYRLSLSFEQLVPDYKAAPTRDHLDLQSDSGDVLSGLEALAKQAKAAGVSFVVQLSQGDDTAKAAVEHGVWGAWVTTILTAFAQAAPDVTQWTPWNEPNNTGFGDGGTYATQVLKPFYEAVKSAEPNSTVVGGESLNVSPGWWSQLAGAGGCRYLDVVAIHPYTGFNQSWEESGLTGADGQIAQLKKVLSTCGAGAKPIWDTESGWTSDGPSNMWGQADSLARAAVWMKVYGISQWNYFITEGGFGDNDLSLSLIQYESHVKPAALAFMTSNELLAGRGAPTPVATGIPGANAMTFGPAAGHADQLTAVWTDDLAIPAKVVTSAAAAVTVTDEYGASATHTVTPASPLTLPFSGAVTYLSAPAGVQLTVQPVQTFGSDLLSGGQASASSSASGAPASGVLGGDFDNSTPWQSGTLGGKPDLSPTLTVKLAQPAVLDRVLISGQSIHCCTAGLRDYDVQVQGQDGSWKTVASVKNQFYDRSALITFSATQASAVRISVPTIVESGVTVMDANYSGLVGGLHPAFWALEPASDKLIAIRSLAAYGP